MLGSDDAGSNDTGLKSVWGSGAESIECQTEYGYYNIHRYTDIHRYTQIYTRRFESTARIKATLIFYHINKTN
jgi:hypothetical protein